MIIQLSPCIPVITPKGQALAHFLIDYGIESHLFWVCFQDSTGECWTFKNPEVRAQKNITQGRDYISPFYDPDDVALVKEHDPNHTELLSPRQHYIDMLSKENELLKDTKSSLETICRDQLNEIESLHNEIQKLKESIGKSVFEKQIKEAKRMSKTPLPEFEDLVKGANSIVDDKISKISSELRGNEMKILDDFCKAYYAAVMYMTGKEFMQIIQDVSLNVQQFVKDGQAGTRYWFSPTEKKDG